MAILPYSLAVSSEPAIEPVTVDEAKRNSDEDDNHRDSDFARWITEGRRLLEEETRRSYINRTLVMKLDSFPACDHIELHNPPLVSVSSIAYLDTDGNSQTWATGNYEVDANRTPGVVHLAYEASYPTTRGTQNAVTITYIAGYGATAASVPAEAKAAILLYVKHRYDNPESGEMPMGWSALASRLCWGSYP
jgi:uncharacterized phiE125 gp8 family phage protein